MSILSFDETKRDSPGILIDGISWLEDAAPRLSWREAGASGWRDSTGSCALSSRGRTWAFAECGVVAEVETRRLDERSWRMSGTLSNRGGRPVELARFHYLHGRLRGEPAGEIGLLAPTPHAEGCRLFRRGEVLRPVKENAEALWRSMDVTWPRMADPVHIRPIGPWPWTCSPRHGTLRGCASGSPLPSPHSARSGFAPVATRWPVLPGSCSMAFGWTQGRAGRWTRSRSPPVTGRRACTRGPGAAPRLPA